MRLFSNRGYVWHYSYQELKSDFLFGFGPDNFPYEFPQDNPDTELYSSQIAFDKPHNMYMQVLADGGVFALIGFVYLLVTFLLKLRRQMYKTNDDMTMNFVKAIFLTVVAYMIQGFINDNHISIQPILYTVLGVGMSLCYYLEKNNNEKSV
jgi:O-antigen ligase